MWAVCILKNKQRGVYRIKKKKALLMWIPLKMYGAFSKNCESFRKTLVTLRKCRCFARRNGTNLNHNTEKNELLSTVDISKFQQQFFTLMNVSCLFFQTSDRCVTLTSTASLVRETKPIVKSYITCMGLCVNYKQTTLLEPWTQSWLLWDNVYS